MVSFFDIIRVLAQRGAILVLAYVALVLLPLPVWSATGDNAANSTINLALLPSAVLTGTAADGRGQPGDILFNPATGTYAVPTSWNEYGVAYNANLGKVTESNAFTWQVSWPTAKTINYITIGGAYPNQPQTTTAWKVQRRLGSTWTTISEGTGGWISDGIFVWGGAGQPAVVADAIRLLAYSNGTNDVVSMHVRGRGGQSTGIDDRSTAIKATLVQYLPNTSVPTDPPGEGGVNILFDTDIGPDCDDAGTLAILHAMADLGECRILGMAACVSSPDAAPCLDAINTYYGRPNLPIGTLKDTGFHTYSAFSNNVATNFPNDLVSGVNAPNATTLYRQILAAQPDNSVVFVAVGPLRNLRHLVRSSGDAASPLSGRDLLAQKVKRTVIMGGAYKVEWNYEWNFYQDALSAKIVCSEWPNEIVFSGWEIGGTVHTGHTLSTVTPVSNPIRRAYEVYLNGPNKSRPSWDQTALYYAVRGGDGLFGLSGPGTVTVKDDGYNKHWSGATGKHRYMTKLVSDTQIAAVIEGLMTRPPGQMASNQAPTVSAGPNRSITLPATASLDGTVTDDGLPAGATVSQTWSTVSGPGTVTFATAGAVDTTASFSVAGTYVLRLTASDTALSASDEVQVVVNAAVNTAPTISAIADRTVNEDVSTGVIAFTVGDSQTATGSLTVFGSSSNTALVPNANVVFGGSGANRTVTVTPAANQHGTTTITVTVSDGSLTAQELFALNVTAVNDLPTISTITDRTVNVGVGTGTIAFTVGDVETAAGSLTVSGSSSNTTLVPNAHVVMGGSGANRTVTVTPVAGQSGGSTITVTVSDGTANVASTFLLTVSTDTTPPVTPSAPTINNTISPTPTLSGISEPGAIIRIYAYGVLVGSTTANGSGAWSWTVSPALPSGVHTLTVTATDASNNTSAASPAVVVTVPASDSDPDPIPPHASGSPSSCGSGLALVFFAFALLGLRRLD